MTTWAGMPRHRAARARAAAWFPEEWVATPRFASSSLKEKTALQAPRILKAPAFWKFSHLKKISPPAIRLIVEEVKTGVLWTKGRILSWACRISSKDGSAFILIPLLPDSGGLAISRKNA